MKTIWANLAATAAALGMLVRAQATADIADLKEQISDLFDEAKAIEKAAEARPGGELTAEESARWDAILDEDKGELAALQAKLEAAEKLQAERHRLAAAKRIARERTHPLHPSDRIEDGQTPQARTPKKRFECRNEATGQVVQALGPQDSFAQYAAERAARDYRGPAVEEIAFSALQSFSAAHGGTDSTGGFAVDAAPGGQLIDYAFADTVAMSAGAWRLPMDTREAHFIRHDSAATAHWRAETVNVPTTDVEHGRLTLSPKTLAMVLAVSVELLEDSSNAIEWLRTNMQGAFKQAIDLATLFGTGAESQPLGIVNTPGVNSIGSVGTPTTYSHPSQAVQQILNANYNGETSDLAWVNHPDVWGVYDGLTATDGQPKRPTPWAESLRRFSTTSVPTNLGGGGNEAQAIVGDFSQVVIGVRANGVRLRVLESGSFTDSAGQTHEAATSLQKLLVAYIRLDVGVLRPSWLTVLNGITTS